MGHPLNISLLYEYTGLDPETGFYTVKDINDDGSYDYEDRIIIQDLNRKYYGGITNNLRFKNFSLQCLVEFVKQEGKNTLFNAGRDANVLAMVLSNERYQEYSQTSRATTAFNRIVNSNFPVEDASFLRLKTVSINYNLGNSFSKKIGLENIRLFLHGQNLFTLTSYNGLDPDESNSGSGFRNLRSITAGIQVNL